MMIPTVEELADMHPHTSFSCLLAPFTDKVTPLEVALIEKINRKISVSPLMRIPSPHV